MAYYWWLIAALLFFVIEILTPGFVVLWFGVGALGAALCDYIGIHSLLAQVLVFGVVSIVLVALSRTIFKNIFIWKSPGKNLKSFVDSLVGSTGVVTEEINNELSIGRVLVSGQDWTARAVDNSIISKDAIVKVVSFEGVKLFVQKID